MNICGEQRKANSYSGETITAPKIKIVACKSGDAPEGKKPEPSHTISDRSELGSIRLGDMADDEVEGRVDRDDILRDT